MAETLALTFILGSLVFGWPCFKQAFGMPIDALEDAAGAVGLFLLVIAGTALSVIVLWTSLDCAGA